MLKIDTCFRKMPNFAGLLRCRCFQIASSGVSGCLITRYRHSCRLAIKRAENPINYCITRIFYYLCKVDAPQVA